MARKHNTAAGFLIGHRVQIPAYTDAWMQGDRYGKVVGFGVPKSDQLPAFARVKLDKSGRTIKVTANDLRFT